MTTLYFEAKTFIFSNLLEYRTVLERELIRCFVDIIFWGNYTSLLESGNIDVIENIKGMINLCDALYFVLLQSEFFAKLSMCSTVNFNSFP
jgi:hypothetical protein